MASAWMLADVIFVFVCMQDTALRSIAYHLDQREKGWHSGTKPLVLLFAGPSRVGKSEAAKQISNVFFSKPLDPKCMINMGQYHGAHECARLNGAPPGYAGNQDGELAFLRNCSESVVILDEIEKAHSSTRDFFLSVFDNGKFTTGGGLVDCQSTVFVMTSNVGHELMAKEAAAIREMPVASHNTFGEEKLRPLFIREGWRPEFWNRIEVVVPFLPLAEESQVAGAARHLQVYRTSVVRRTFS